MTAKSPLPLTKTGEPRAFFGRRSGAKMLNRQHDALFDDLLPKLEIVFQDGPLDLDALFGNTRPVFIEIGYGGGEHLARQAMDYPGRNYIGCEVFSGGIGKLLRQIAEQKLGNIRLFTDDALKLLYSLPDGSLSGAYLLYPDPWPKLRHHKRRFVSPTTIAELARVLQPGSEFRFASDIEDYANWTLAHILREPRFAWPRVAPGSWHTYWPDWQPTRYEEKARRQGRDRSFYFSFVRR